MAPAYVLQVKVEMEMELQQYEKAKAVREEQLERLTQICQEQAVRHAHLFYPFHHAGYESQSWRCTVLIWILFHPTYLMQPLREFSSTTELDVLKQEKLFKKKKKEKIKPLVQI